MNNSAAPKIFEDLNKTDLEKKILQVTFGYPRIGGAKDEEETKKKIIRLLGNWRRYLASPTNLGANAEQIDLEAKFLIRHFGLLTIADFEWCIELYLLRDLPFPYTDMLPVINVDFLVRVTHSYLKYKAGQCKRLDEVYAKWLERKNNRGCTPEQNTLAMREFFIMVKEQLGRNDILVQLVKDVYRYLDRTGQLNKEVENSEEAHAYAKARMEEYMKVTRDMEKPPSIRDLLRTRALTEEDQKNLYTGYRCEFAVKKYLDSRPMEEILNRIQPSDWVKEKQQTE